MALCKDIIAPQGYVTSYHKITEVSLGNGILSCLLTSYVSQEYRGLEKPAIRKKYHFNIKTEEEESMGVRQLAYKKIKELDEWADATDC